MTPTNSNTAGPIFPAISISRHRIETDGEGITTLVAAHGCPFACRYCLNPHSTNPYTKVRRYTPSDLLDIIKVDNLYFLATGGGITFGGGEPLLYADFITEFRAIAPPEWKIIVETALGVPSSNIAAAAQAADFFIVDIKDMDDAIFQSYTGRSPERSRENLPYLLSLVGPERIRVRVPLIKDYNTVENQKKSKAILQDMGFTNIELFSYRVNE